MRDHLSQTTLRAFLSELMRRKVVKVGAVYIGVSFAAMQVAGSFFPALHLPDWGQTLVAALLILGFPVAVALAWVFELTPRGLRLEAPAPPDEPGPETARVRAAAPQPPAPGSVIRHTGPVWSVAVIPFVDMSPDRDQEFFVEGIAEEIRHALARVDGLSVVARCSSLAYRDASLDVREIGRQLGVSAVVEGSLRKWKDRVIVHTRLVSVVDGFDLWSEAYESTPDDILTVQSDIARALIVALGPRLPSGTPIIRGNTLQPVAHRAFLKGRHLCDRPGRHDLERAIAFFQEATELDPVYAAAYVGLSDAHSNMARLGHSPPRDAMPAAKAAALRALAIDPDLAAAHKSLAIVLHRYEWKAEEAEMAFRRSLELNPGYANARFWLGEFLLLAGRYEEAIEMLALGQDIDPVSVLGSAHLVMATSLAGQPERALRQAEEAVALNPRGADAHRVLGQLLLRQGRSPEAIETLEQARLFDPTDAETITALCAAYRALRRLDQVARLQAELAGVKERRWALPYHRAALSAATGDTDKAIAALELYCDARGFDLVRATVDPAFDPLRRDARFQRVLAKLDDGRVHSGLQATVSGGEFVHLA